MLSERLLPAYSDIREYWLNNLFLEDVRKFLPFYREAAVEVGGFYKRGGDS